MIQKSKKKEEKGQRKSKKPLEKIGEKSIITL